MVLIFIGFMLIFTKRDPMMSLYIESFPFWTQFQLQSQRGFNSKDKIQIRKITLNQSEHTKLCSGSTPIRKLSSQN